MKKYLSKMMGLLLISGCIQAQDRQQGQLEDLQFLRTELENHHPGLDWYTSKDSMSHFFQEATDAVQKGRVDELEFYRIIRRLITDVRCGHTFISMPDSLEEAVLSSSRYMPISVVTLGEKVIVNKTLEGSALRKGDNILAINGRPISEITSEILKYQSGDGYVSTGRRLAMTRYFRLYYQLFVQPDATNYSMQVSRQGQELSVSLENRPWAELGSLAPDVEDSEPLSMVHGQGYSILRIETFSQGYISSRGQDFSRFLKDAFRELKDRGVQHLILDLRGNGGGRDNYGAELVSYLLDQPFSYFKEITVTDAYDGYGGIKDLETKRVVTKHRGLSRYDPARNHYDANLYVLIDGGSFSTCADVASVLKSNGRQLLIGEETGGGAQGNTSGARRTITLPNSGIEVYIPLWKYRTALADAHQFGRGVVPDVEVIPSTVHFMEGTDAVMEACMSLIEQKKKG